MLEEAKGFFYLFLHDCLFDDNLFIFITSFLLTAYFILRRLNADSEDEKFRVTASERRLPWSTLFYTTFKLAFMSLFYY